MRLAGTGLLEWGGRVTWTIADGVRGRRWRAMLLDDGQVVGALLLETSPDGGLQKLELATAAGLLTLHPEGTTLHGNVVRPVGVQHISLPWSEDRVLLVVGTPATAAAAARRLLGRIGVGEGHTVPAVSVDIALAVRPVTLRILRPAEKFWRFVPADGGPETAVTLDDAGIPILDEPETWPLEREAGA